MKTEREQYREEIRQLVDQIESLWTLEQLVRFIKNIMRED